MNDETKGSLLRGTERLVAFLAEVELTPDLIARGWSEETVDRIRQSFERLQVRIQAGWIPEDRDTMNMGRVYDDIGITPKGDDVVMSAVSAVAHLFNSAVGPRRLVGEYSDKASPGE